MTAKRILAVLAAVALIVAALLIRNGLDDDSSSTTDGTDQPSGGKATVICSTEFKAVCETLDTDDYTVTIEPAGKTLDALAKDGAAPPDAWITLDPFPGMVDDTRQRASLPTLSPRVVTVATDAPLLAVPTARLAQFNAACSGQNAWKCVGVAAGQQWGDLAPGAGGEVLPGLADPALEASGLVTFGNAVSGFFGGTGFGSNDFEGNDFRGWMRNVGTEFQVVSSPTSPLGVMLNRPSQINVAATSNSETLDHARATEFKVVSTTPAFLYRAVVAAFGPRATGLAATITPVLTKSRWAASADPQSPLPAGTFIALRRLWEGK